MIGRTPFERTVPRFFRSSYVFWPLFALAFAAVAIALAPSTRNPGAYLGLCVPQALGLMIVPLAFRRCFESLEQWADNIPRFVEGSAHGGPAPPEAAREWFLEQISFNRRSAGFHVSGAVVSSAALATLFADYFLEFQGGARAYAIGLTLLSGFFAGAGIYGIAVGARALWRLGRCYRIRVARHSFGVLSTGDMLVTNYLIIAGVWTVYLSTIFTGNPGSDPLRGAGLPFLALGIPTSIAVFSSFVLCLAPLHARMVEYKRRELLRIEDALDRLVGGDDARELSADVWQKVDFLERRREQFMALPEWPFDKKSLLGAAATSTIPLLANYASSMISRLVSP